MFVDVVPSPAPAALADQAPDKMNMGGVPLSSPEGTEANLIPVSNDADFFTEDVPVPDRELYEPVTSMGRAGWQLKKLSPKHRDVCALVAQGLGRSQIAALCQITPEYVTMLTRQPLCIAEIRKLNEFAGIQLEAMFSKSVEAIADTLETGNAKEKMQAARLQLEATKRIGRPDPSASQGAVGSEERLLALAERLTGLLAGARQQSLNAEQVIEDAEFTDVTREG